MADLTPAPPAPAVAAHVRCQVCGRTADCTGSQFLRFSRKGFPWCCGETMSARPVSDGSGETPAHIPKRLGLRHPAQPRAQLEFRRGALGLGPDLGVELVDVSDDGLCVHIKESVAPGDEVEVLVGRPLGGKLYKRRAQVRWCRPAWAVGFLVEVVFCPKLSVIEVREIAR